MALHVENDPILAAEYVLAKLAEHSDRFRQIMSEHPRGRGGGKAPAMKSISPDERARGFALFARGTDDWIFDDTVPTVKERRGAKVLRAVAPQGGVAHAAVAVRAIDNLQPLVIETSALRFGGNTLPANRVVLRAAQPHLVRMNLNGGSAWGWYPKFLLSRRSVDMAAGVTTNIRISVDAPGTAKAGVYRGTLTLAGAGRGRGAKVALEIEVIEADVARAPIGRVMLADGWMGREEIDYAAAAGFTATGWTWSPERLPITAGRQGRPFVDPRPCLGHLETLAAADLPDAHVFVLSAGPETYGDHLCRTLFGTGFSEAAYTGLPPGYRRAYAESVSAQFTIFPEPPRLALAPLLPVQNPAPGRAAYVEEMCRTLREAVPHLMIIAPADGEGAESGPSAADVWLAERPGPRLARAAAQAGKKVWAFVRANVQADILGVRMESGLRAWAAGVAGIAVWQSSTARGDPFNDFDGNEPDETLTWATPHGFVDSIAGLQLRQGIADADAMATVEKACAAAEASGRTAARTAARAARKWLASAARAASGRSALRFGHAALKAGSPAFADAVRAEALRRAAEISKKLR
jgi:hypothetical protein